MASDTPTPEELCRASEVRDGAEVCGATFIAGWVCDLDKGHKWWHESDNVANERVFWTDMKEAGRGHADT